MITTILMALVCALGIWCFVLFLYQEVEVLDDEQCKIMNSWFSKPVPESTEEKKVFGMTLADVEAIRSEIDDFEETFGEHVTQDES